MKGESRHPEGPETGKGPRREADDLFDDSPEAKALAEKAGRQSDVPKERKEAGGGTAEERGSGEGR